MSKDDPYGDDKVYHYAHMMNPKGKVSPLCADKPRAINLDRASWTIVEAQVTCPKCLKRLKERHPQQPTGARKA